MKSLDFHLRETGRLSADPKVSIVHSWVVTRSYVCGGGGGGSGGRRGLEDSQEKSADPNIPSSGANLMDHTELSGTGMHRKQLPGQVSNWPWDKIN